ncbi:MAG TPA: TylF/MycF/NovP-related O-methyltransferase [Gammaproteobacteria bacterium]|jgi:hypothetical protein
MDTRTTRSGFRVPHVRSMVSRCGSALRGLFGLPPEATIVARELRRIGRLSNPREVYEARFGLLARLAHAWGFEVYNMDCAWQEDAGFWSVWKEFSGGQSQRADRKFVVWTLARHASRLPGDTAECGVYEGASSHLICAAYEGRADHRHHVFDSFEGLSEPGPEDDPASSLAPRWRPGDLRAPLETVRANLSRFGFVDYYRGWIPERFHEVADRRFSLVHIDVDLYQPTRDSLEFFYPRLVPGGILLCDDYGSRQCVGAKRAFDDFVASRPERSVIHLPTIQGLIIKV